MQFPSPLAPVEKDLQKHRNATFIDYLIKSSFNGVFLFGYSDGKEVLLLPPGLTEAQIQSFKAEFMSLFEKYAEIAMKSR